jgi:hypothetical protein
MNHEYGGRWRLEVGGHLHLRSQRIALPSARVRTGLHLLSTRVLGCGADVTLPPHGQGYTSLEIKIRLLRPVMADTGQLTAGGVATKPGSRATFADGTVR